MSIVDRLKSFGDAKPELTADEADPLESRLDDLFVALSNSRRRFVIDNLADRDDDEWVPAAEFVDGLTYVENDGLESIDDATTEQRKRVYIGLTQSGDHLDKLSEWGLLEYDSRAKRVRKTAGTMVARRLLRAGYWEVSSGEGWYA